MWKFLRKSIPLTLAVAGSVALLPNVGYGSRTYLQGMAKLSKQLRKYLQAHEVAIKAVLSARGDATDAIACVDGVISCLVVLEGFLNTSAS